MAMVAVIQFTPLKVIRYIRDMGQGILYTH